VHDHGGAGNDDPDDRDHTGAAAARPGAGPQCGERADDGETEISQCDDQPRRHRAEPPGRKRHHQVDEHRRPGAGADHRDAVRQRHRSRQFRQHPQHADGEQQWPDPIARAGSPADQAGQDETQADQARDPEIERTGRHRLDHPRPSRSRKGA